MHSVSKFDINQVSGVTDNMIQIERERRVQLQAEKEALRLAKAAQEAAQKAVERQKIAEELVDMAKEDRRFLEELKIPEYLQAIIDEEQLKGAYVLWRSIHPINLGTDNPSVVGGGVSLVWNIGYTREMVKRTRFADNGYSPSREEWVSGDRNGYGYKSIDVTGSSKTNSIHIAGMRNEVLPPPDFEDLERLRRQYIFKDPRLIPYEILNPDMRPRLLMTNTKTILSGSQLGESEVRQVLASTYLDTKECFATIKGVGWKFDREVPEQKRNHIPESK